MKNNFIEDGPLRLQRGQKELTREALMKRYAEVEKKYAREIAASQPHQREHIYQRMADDLPG